MADFSRIEKALDLTREALCKGDMPALDGLAAEVEAAIAEPGACSRAVARRLADKAALNERLIAAAMQGIRAAKRRAQDLTDQGRFSTYDATGRRGQPGLAPETARGTRL